MARPHLILTLRRTGGTSLTSFLAKVSEFPSVQHEPFNPDRTWGETTRTFRETGDLDRMRASVKEQLAASPNVKHCAEIIPLEVTRALIETCAAQDYGIFLLTRRDEARRLYSLFLAFATGAWGPEEAAEIYPEIISGQRQPEPIDLAAARRRIGADAAVLGQVLALLRHRNIPFEWLIFEEIYNGDTPTKQVARGIAGKLGIAVKPDDKRLRAFSRGEGQKSADIEPYVPGARELRETLERLVIN